MLSSSSYFEQGFWKQMGETLEEILFRFVAAVVLPLLLFFF